MAGELNAIPGSGGAQERRWLVWVIVLAVIIANLPSALGFLAAPADTTYTGIDSTAPGDVNVYLSYLEQARQGNLLFRDLFTGEAQRATIGNPFWLGLGLIGSVLNLPPVATYFLARIVLGALLLLLIYALAAKFFSDLRRRRIAWLLAVFGSGIGAWAAPFIDTWFRHNVPGPAWPMDLWVSEGFTFLSLHHSPHFLAATILILLSVWWMMRAVEDRGLKPVLYLGLAMLGLFSFHPFHVVSLGLVTIAFLVVTWLVRRREILRQVGRYAMAWLIASPAIAYQAWLILRDPLAAGRAAQNILLTTWPGITVLSYGFLLVGAVVGAVLLLRQATLRVQLLVAWAIAHGAAIYFPVFFNRRLTQGLNIALALLAAVAVAALLGRLERTARKATGLVWLSVSGLFLFGMSTLWVTAQDLSYILSSGRRAPHYFFLDRGYNELFQWLRVNGDDKTVVLSAPISGNFIPGRSGRRVVIGHNVETVDFEAKRREVVRFYSGQESAAWRTAFLRRSGATYVVFGPWESQIGSFAGDNDPNMILVFSRDSVRLYRVVGVN